MFVKGSNTINRSKKFSIFILNGKYLVIIVIKSILSTEKKKKK